MKYVTLAIIALTLAAQARPVAAPSLSELQSRADYVMVIRPVSIRQTTDKPDDQSFGDRDMNNYQSLETECEVECVFKGEVASKKIKIVHFAYEGPAVEFNGGWFMRFLFKPTRLVTFPATTDNEYKPDPAISNGYALGNPEYMAFLRRLPDGRYAAAAPQYDASVAFRVLTTPTNAQRYHAHPAASPKTDETK